MGEPDDRAGRLLRAVGLDRDTQAAHLVAAMAEYTDPAVNPGKAPPNPRLRQVFGAAEGLAAILGDGVVCSTDGLLAYLWQDDGQQLFLVERQGSTGQAIVDALVADGLRVPPMALPEPDRVPWGEKVPVPADRVRDVVAVVQARHPGHPCLPGPDWVLAKAHIDLRTIVDEVLAAP